MRTIHCTAKDHPMSKKHNYTRPVRVADKSGDELLTFPADRHVVTPAQRELPNPAAALAGGSLISDRARREALAILEREDARRDARAGIPYITVHEDLQSVRRRPLDAPMATRIGDLPDPIATMAWEAVVMDAHQTARAWWGRWAFTAALAIWSAACFLLGRLA